MIYYEISFPLTLIFKQNFVKVLLSMTFISLKTSNILENKLQGFERSDYGCSFVAKFNDWLSCVQQIDLNTFKNSLFNIQQK